MTKGDIETYYEDGQWKNRPQGNQRASNTHDTKAQARAAGRDMAKDREVEHIVKKMDSTIGERLLREGPAPRRAETASRAPSPCALTGSAGDFTQLSLTCAVERPSDGRGGP